MSAGNEREPVSGHHPTTAERASEREAIVTRAFDAPARAVFDAWTKPELLRQWWTPQSFGLTFVSCEADVRVGGSYRFVFRHPAAAEPMAFFGRYTDVVPGARLVWTNEEGGEGGAITTVTFEARGGGTLVTMHELHASKEALDEAMSSGSMSCFDEMFRQLDALLAGGGR